MNKTKENEEFISLFSDFIPIENKWYHLKCVIKKENAEIFIDGIQIYPVKKEDIPKKYR